MPSDTRRCDCGQEIAKPRRGPWPKRCTMCKPRHTRTEAKPPCSECGGELPSRRRKFCSDDCFKAVAAERSRRRYSEDAAYAERARARLRVSRRSCFDCGTDLGPKTDLSTGPRWCDICRAERLKATNRRKNAKRKGARTGIRYTLTEIGDRDGWKCHLCHRKVDRTLPGTHDKGPTPDHLVPIAEGGSDDPSNVALAHRACNIKRRDKGIAQLRLIG